MKAIKDLRNDLLNRREVKLLVENRGNPGMTSASKMFSEHFKTEEDKIAVKALKGKFGRDTFLIDAYIYDSVSDKKRIEPKIKISKKAAEAAAAAAPAPAAVGGKK
jgi:ribosomal protein S24E